MSDEIDKWMEELLNQLASGEAVDWDGQQTQNSEEAELLAQFKNIDQIRTVFATQKPNSVDAQEKPSTAAYFEWGHLQVNTKLGEGAYGEVFSAFDPVLNRQVALKLLKPDQLAAFHSKLFIEEARRIARVRNRHVLAIHGAGVNDGRAGFWSDLIEGSTLVNKSNFNVEKLLQVATALANALGAVHQAGLVHGDVKAANIMQDQNGQYVLMDFGAGLERDAQHSSNHSIGSPLLMAPELFVEASKTPASDIYALGCVLFNLASGQYPVVGENILDIADAHEQQNYASITKLRPDFPTSLLNLLSSMIDPDARHRPSAATVLESLSWIENEPRRKKKRRMVLGIIGSLMVGLVLASTGGILANQERKKAVLAQQKAEAVNDFLQEILGASYSLGTGRDVRVADVLDLAGNHSLNDFNDQPEILADLSATLGRSYLNLKAFEKSRQQLLRSLSLKKKLLGEKHPETLRVMLLLAKIQESTGDYQASMESCLTIMALSEHNVSLKGIYLNAQVSLASVYTALGKFEDAYTLLTELVLQVSETGTVSNQLFLIQLAQSQNYLKMSKFEAAETAAEQAITTIKQVKNFKTSNLLAAKNQLAVAFSSQGEYAEAEIIYYELLALAEKIYGVNNIGYLRILNNLGANLQSQGKLDKAVVYQEQAVEITEKLYGSRNPNTILGHMNLANTYVSLKRLEEGETMMRSALESAKSVLGELDSNTLTIQYNLGELLNNTGRFAASYELSTAALPIMLQALGEQHLVTLLTQDNVAVSLSGLNRHQEAAQLFEVVSAAMASSFGQSSPYYMLVKGHQVDGLIKSNDMDLAVAAQRQLLETQLRVLGEDHQEVLKSKSKLQKMLINQ